LGTFSSKKEKKESVRTWGKVFKIREEIERKNGDLGENIGNCYKLWHGCPGFSDLF